MADNIDFILKRRSIRLFDPRPVEAEKITMLLKAGMAAPSSMNSQPWEFVVVTEEPVLEQLRAAHEHGKMVAPLVIVPLGSPKVAANAAGETYWIQDCTLAAENILLAAANINLGGVWVGIYPRQARMAAIREILNLPADVFPLCLLHIGYPAEEKPAHSKYRVERVHWQRYKIENRDLPNPSEHIANQVVKKA